MAEKLVRKKIVSPFHAIQIQLSCREIKSMKVKLTLLTYVSLVCAGVADDASHRQVASELLDLSGTREAMRAGFLATIEPNVAAMTQQGMPPAAANEIRTALTEWFEQEIKWEEIKPKLIELYVKEFTEAELKELNAFYRTPIGSKAISKIPAIMQQGSIIGQQYAATKQDSLKLKIEAIAQKYRPKKTP